MIAIGKPFEGVDALIMDNNGSPVATGETGELWISGRQVMNGYWNAPEKNKECLIEGKDFNVHFTFRDIVRFKNVGDICNVILTKTK